MIAFILSSVGQRVLMIGAAVLAVLAVLFGARQAGKNAARVEGYKEQLRNVKVRTDVQNDTDRLSDGDLDKRLQRWTRD